MCLLQIFHLEGVDSFRPLNVSYLAELWRTGSPQRIIHSMDFRIWDGVFAFLLLFLNCVPITILLYLHADREV